MLLSPGRILPCIGAEAFPWLGWVLTIGAIFGQMAYLAIEEVHVPLIPFLERLANYPSAFLVRRGTLVAPICTAVHVVSTIILWVFRPRRLSCPKLGVLEPPAGVGVHDFMDEATAFLGRGGRSIERTRRAPTHTALPACVITVIRMGSDVVHVIVVCYAYVEKLHVFFNVRLLSNDSSELGKNPNFRGTT